MGLIADLPLHDRDVRLERDVHATEGIGVLRLGGGWWGGGVDDPLGLFEPLLPRHPYESW